MSKNFSVERLRARIVLATAVCLLSWGVPIVVTTAQTPPSEGAGTKTSPRRTPADKQIGTVVMPYDGFLSSAIYDADGNMIRTLLARSAQKQGNVELKWDGRDDLGRPAFRDGKYTWKALTSQVKAVELGGIGDSQFSTKVTFPDGNILESNDQVDCIAVSPFPEVTADVGGVFAPNDSESSFGDTTLSQKFTLNDAISASGSFYFFANDLLNMDGEFFLGHYSTSTTNDRREFIGLEFGEGDVDGQLKVCARMNKPDGLVGNGTASDWIVLLALSGDYRFAYTYDPTHEADANHKGSEGKLTLQIFNESKSFDQTAVAVLEAGHRDSHPEFDAFGVGIAKGAVGSHDTTKTAKVFIDDVTYSGRTDTLDFTTDPGWKGSGNTTSGNNYGWHRSEASGGIYQASQGEEGATLRKFAQDGTPLWYQGGVNVGVAANARHVYVSQRFNDQDLISRYLAQDGTYSPFSRAKGGQIVVNAEPFDPRPKGQNRYTPEQYRQQYALWGMAADSHRLWVSNYRKARVEVYDGTTGLKVAELPAKSPLGLAIETDRATSGTIWLAHQGNRVSRFGFTIKGDVYKFTEDTTRRIADLREPSGISIGGPKNHLFVAEKGTGEIREYDIRQAPLKLDGLGSSFGSLQQSGPVKEDQFRWVRWAGIAVDQKGILNVVDDRRIQRFYTQANAKEGIAAGDLYQSWWGEFGPAPIDTYNYTTDGKFTLISGCYEYEVDPEYTGGPRKGWLGDGTWRIVGRFFDEGVGVRRTLMDGKTPREFRFVFEGTRSVVAHALSPPGDRLSAIVGVNWVGVDRLQNPNGGLFNWTDTDGDGEIDWGGVRSGTSGEVIWNLPLGETPPLGPYSLHAGWVDYDGNVWQIVKYDLVKIPLEGFDAQHNPIYNWAHVVTVVPFQDDEWDFMPRFVRTAANGDIYALGATKFNGNLSPTGGSNVHGGDWIARYDSSGKRQLLRPIVFDNTDNTPPATAFDENDPKSEYFYVGVGEGSYFYIHQYTKDGLLVSQMSTEDSGVMTGWIDHQYGVGVVTHPKTHQCYVFGEDIVYGRTVPFRLDNLSTVKRQEGSFAWDVARKPAGHWKFQDSLDDSAGSNAGVFLGGKPSYVERGVVGKAIALDGSQDYLELPVREDLAAYTITAWVKPTKTKSVNVITRSAANTSNQDIYQLRINSGAGKFEHSIVDVADRKVAGKTIVQPNTWYHVAIVAARNDKMRLYVNGKEDGEAQSIGTISAAGDCYRVGVNSVSFGHFAGAIDELRIFDFPLSTNEINSLFGQATVVTVAATDTHAAEAKADTGMFTIHRSKTKGDLVVDYTVGGTAKSGADYASLSGSVTIADGKSSATVTVTPIDEQDNDPSETVILTIKPSEDFVATTPNSAMVVIADNEAVGDPGWASVGNKSDGNDYGWSHNTDHAGGAAGEIGGTFARNEKESYYADTELSRTFSFNDEITASGKLSIFGQMHTDQEWVMGHMSSDTADSSTLGIEFKEEGDNSVQFWARAGAPQGTGTDSEPKGLPNGQYNFTYTYKPSLSRSGRVTVRIYNGSYDQTTTSELNAETRASDATFNAFGIGIKNKSGVGPDSGKTIQMFIDEVSYSGARKTGRGE